MRIAVVGSGISGLGAAHLLSRAHDVTLFERDDRFGGHACTVGHRGLDLDCGFLVCNETTYPLLLRLFDELSVRTRATEMSFSLTCDAHDLTWSGRSLPAQARNLLRPGFARLSVDIVRWLRAAPRALDAEHRGRTLAEFVDDLGLSDDFRRHFLAPFASALWSTDPDLVLDIPAEFAVRFFVNHGLVGFRRVPWLTVEGGSRQYVERIVERLGDRARCGLGVRSIERRPDAVEIRADDDTVERFDQVVVATHADVALRLLADPTEEERRALGRFRYSANETVLHTDVALLPERRADWSAWNVHTADCQAPDPRATVSYSLDRLLGLVDAADESPDVEHHIVTLNRTAAIDPERIIARFPFEHPVFDADTVRGQDEIAALTPGRTHFAGAHLGWGFHEDGLRSAVRVARTLGVSW